MYNKKHCLKQTSPIFYAKSRQPPTLKSNKLKNKSNYKTKIIKIILQITLKSVVLPLVLVFQINLIVNLIFCIYNLQTQLG